MVHGLVSAGLITMESIINFFSRPFAGQAIASAHSSIALPGIVGLKVKSLAYSFKR
jgi:hypothetical protein